MGGKSKQEPTSGASAVAVPVALTRKEQRKEKRKGAKIQKQHAHHTKQTTNSSTSSTSIRRYEYAPISNITGDNDEAKSEKRLNKRKKIGSEKDNDNDDELPEGGGSKKKTRKKKDNKKTAATNRMPSTITDWTMDMDDDADHPHEANHDDEDGVDPDAYDDMDETTAAAMRAEDEVIASLERKLGVEGKRGKEKLYKEYSKLEGYGDDFGNFLDGLDHILTTGTSSSGGGAAGMIGHGSDDDSDLENDDANDDRYGHVDTGRSREVDSDNDEDSEELVPMKDPHKSSSSSSSSAEEEDDDEDNLSFDDGMNVNGTDPQQSQDDDDDEDEAPILIKVDDEENSRDDDDDVSSEDEDEAVGSDSDGENKDSDNDASNDKSDNDVSEDAMDDDDITGSRNSSDDEDEEPQPLTMADRNTQDTYRPVKGQDIYGRAVSVDNTDTKPSKYIPPHLRRLQQQGDQTNKADKHEAAFASSEKDLTMIRRTLNGLLNRLSEDTLDSVAKHLASLYHQPNYIKSDISQCLSEKVMQTCVSKEQLMGASTPLIPLYASTVAAAHMCVEGGAVGSHVVECLVTAFLNKHEEARQACREKAATDTSTQIIQQKYSKESLNLILLLSYLYSFQMVFCTLIYDIIKDLIASFTEVDVEALLLILQHAGFQLRGDDPAALKDIVMLVQERAVGALNSNTTDTNTNTEAEEDNNASRIRYMVSAISDLKNNKRSKADVAQIEKIKRFRKFLGRVKTTAAAEGDAGGYRPGQDTCLRISLQDIRDIPTKGRWWKVGSSWKGNQFLGHDDGNAMDNDTLDRKPGPGSIKRRNKNNNEEDTDPLLTLAAKLGMNTDVRKSIFCIIMGSDDCEDAFEKLTKLGLQGQQDRELVRVLVECCGQEKTYNPYYALLAARLCEWSPKQSKFTFQKVYWDMFGQLLSQDDDEHENNKVKIKIRKVANLAKLFVDLLKERHLSMALLKALDMTELPEAGIIFLTMTLTVLFDSSEPAQVYSIFEAIPVNESGVALRENLSVFLLQYLQKSPKNVKKSKFHKSYKIAVKLCKADAMTMQQEEMF